MLYLWTPSSEFCCLLDVNFDRTAAGVVLLVAASEQSLLPDGRIPPRDQLCPALSTDPDSPLGSEQACEAPRRRHTSPHRCCCRRRWRWSPREGSGSEPLRSPAPLLLPPAGALCGGPPSCAARCARRSGRSRGSWR